MKPAQDEEIRDAIATALNKALKKRKLTADQAADLLRVERGTMYKYLAGDMIPGGQVLWRACANLRMILDQDGFRISSNRRVPAAKEDTGLSPELPFINESVNGKKVQVRVNHKDDDYVRVKLRIKVAG